MKGRAELDTEIQGRGSWEDKGRNWSYTARVQGARKLEAERGKKARKCSPLQKALGEAALLILCFQTPDFQNCENINFYCFKTPAL